eukprot:scaffold22586_cov138-Cylindrotheca_fusiformis.AAC.1
MIGVQMVCLCSRPVSASTSAHHGRKTSNKRSTDASTPTRARMIEKESNESNLNPPPGILTKADR